MAEGIISCSCSKRVLSAITDRDNPASDGHHGANMLLPRGKKARVRLLLRSTRGPAPTQQTRSRLFLRGRARHGVYMVQTLASGEKGGDDQHPERGAEHPEAEKGEQDQAGAGDHYALGAGHEAYIALQAQSFGACAGIA